MSTAAERWRDALAAWAIPDRILASAEETPWIHPPALFGVPDEISPSPSHDRAREALGGGGSVLDVGCGGGVAAYALVPPATRVVGVDQQASMLEMFRANALERHVDCDTTLGSWPEVAAQVAGADVVTAHHVVYNVGDIVPFLRALDEHARTRVVLEMPDHHPLTSMSGAWQHFWQLDRPSTPTPLDLLAVLDEMGIPAQRESWLGALRPAHDLEQAAHFLRIRLCLPAAREPEVYEYLVANPVSAERELSTVWWETTG